MSEPPTLWKNRSFVLLFGAQTISLVGSGATTIGLALFAYRMAGASSAAIVVGNALTLRILAFLLFSQPAGLLADRTNRKAILVASDLGRAGLLALLPFASEIWHIYALIFLLNAATAFFTPVYEASLTTVVGEAHIVEALSVSRVAADVETVASPAVAALIVGVVGARWVFWFDGATYLASAGLLLGAAIPVVGRSTTALSLRTFTSEITYGTRAILREPSLRRAIVLSFVESLAGAAAIVATVAYVKNVLRRGDTSVAVAMAAVGVGSATTAFLLGRATGRYERGIRERSALHTKRHAWGRRALMGGGLCLGMALLPGIFVPPMTALVGLWALNGAGQALIAIPSATLLAEHTTESERGRVYAAHFALTHAFWLVSYPLIGHTVARFGAGAVFTAAGVACLVITGLADRIREPPRHHEHRPPT